MILKDLKVAVVVHLYYEELARDLIGYLKNIPLSLDLYLSTRPGCEERLKDLFCRELVPKRMVVRGVHNRGFDIQPFVVAFGSFYAQYDVLCKIHAKKDSHQGELAGWRAFLLENLLGSPDIVRSVLASFVREEGLGLIFPDYFPPVRPMVEWGSNWETAGRLGNQLNLRLDREAGIEFPAGSMFWVRPRAIEPLLALNLQVEDFEPGAENWRDGTLAHALERLFLPVIESKGYYWKKVLYAPQKIL